MEDLDHFLEKHYIQQIEGGPQKFAENQNRSKDRLSIEILFSSTSFSHGIPDRICQRFLLFIAIIRLIESIIGFVITEYEMKSVGIRILPANGPFHDTKFLTNINFGAMNGGCEASIENQTMKATKFALEINNSDSIVWDGLWMSGVDTTNVQEKFYFEYSSDNESWSRLKCQPWFLSDLFGVITSSGIDKIYADFRAPWYWKLTSYVGPATFTLFCFISILFEILKKRRLANVFIQISYILLSVIEGISAIHLSSTINGISLSRIWSSNTSLLLIAWSYSICFGFLAVGLIMNFCCFEIFLILHCIIAVLCLCEIHYRSIYSSLQLFPKLVWCLLALLACIGLYFSRSFSRKQLLFEILANDTPSSEMTWAEILSNIGVHESLSNLRNLSRELNLKSNEGEARQYFPRTQKEARYSRNRSTRLAGTAHVKSLDHLLDQASCLKFFLEEKFRATAKVGCSLAADSEPTGAAADRPPRVQVCIKSRERAWEKAARCYGSDVSRVLDYCRASVVFERMEDLVRFLESAGRDAELEIVRVKNRYDDAADAGLLAGFRWPPSCRLAAFALFPAQSWPATRLIASYAQKRRGERAHQDGGHAPTGAGRPRARAAAGPLRLREPSGACCTLTGAAAPLLWRSMLDFHLKFPLSVFVFECRFFSAHLTPHHPDIRSYSRLSLFPRVRLWPLIR